MKALIIHTHDQKISSLQAVIAAAQAIAPNIDILAIGQLIKTEDIMGVDHIWHHDHKDLNTSNPNTVAQIIKQYNGYSHIICHSDTEGKTYLPYFAGCAQLPMVSDVRRIIDPKTFERAIYAGAALQIVENKAKVQLLSIRGIYFQNPSLDKQPTIEVISATMSQSDYRITSSSQAASDKPDLSTADVVISGGRGLGSKEGFASIHELADYFHAAVGASRAAVDAGYIGNECQVGQTGKIIAPRIYISFGISGAVQHLSGMKDSQTIIAIDKDPDAPIFQVSDYGYCGDLFEVLNRFKKYKIKR